jgi:hypothetical protein
MPLQDGQPMAELYTLKKDHLYPASTRGLYLAESFAQQQGWLVRDERIRWKDWVRQQGLNPPGKDSGLARLRGKAKQLLKKIVPRKKVSS